MRTAENGKSSQKAKMTWPRSLVVWVVAIVCLWTVFWKGCNGVEEQKKNPPTQVEEVADPVMVASRPSNDQMQVWLVHLYEPSTVAQTLHQVTTDQSTPRQVRRQQVYATLTQAFETSQNQVIHALHSMKSFVMGEWQIWPLWIQNTLVVHRRPPRRAQARAQARARGQRHDGFSGEQERIPTEMDAELDLQWVEAINALDQVRAVEKDTRVLRLQETPQQQQQQLPYDLEDQEHRQSLGQAQGNIQLLHAPELWKQHIEGEGVVIATIDSGVRFTHEALIDNYQGTLNASAKTFNHDYAFWIPPSSDPKQFNSDTADQVGHGTHVMGTAIGRRGIGVAPKAKWITARAFDWNATATKSDFLMASQFVLCPTRFATYDLPDCSRGADVISNSYGMDPSAQDADKWKWMLSILRRWRQAGALTVFSSGNTNGFKCSSVYFPGSSDQTLAVGALVPGGKSLWGASGKGPSVIMDEHGKNKTIVKPDYVAPGMAIRSALSIGDSKYTRMTGTSMATPHIAGVLALLVSGKHDLHPENLTAVVKETTFHAFHKPFLVPSICGKTSYRDLPNNLYGWGMPNACEAAKKLGLECHEEAMNPAGVTEVTSSKTKEHHGVKVASVEVRSRAPDLRLDTCSSSNARLEGFWLVKAPTARTSGAGRPSLMLSTATATAVPPMKRTAGVGDPLTTLMYNKSRASIRMSQQIHAHRHSKRGSFQMVLCGWRFVCCWWILVSFHAAEFSFLVAMAWLYAWLLASDHLRDDLLGNLHFQFSNKTLSRINWCFVAIAVIHGWNLVTICYCSVRTRQLQFPNNHQPMQRSTETSRCAPTSIPRSSFARTPSTHTLAIPPSASRLGSAIRCGWSMVRLMYEYIMFHWIEHVFFLHGERFDDYFLFRECCEVVSQIYQAYQMSVFIATNWINHWFVTMIVLNCMSTPLVHRWVPSANRPLRRLISVSLSAMLNFINAVVIPLIIFEKYRALYDPTIQSFPAPNMYDDVWYAKAQRENEQLFVTSLLDFIMTLTPHWSMLSCLWTCESLLCRGASTHTSPQAVNAVVPFRKPDESCSLSKRSMQLPVVHAKPMTAFARQKEHVIHCVLAILGAVTLGLHVYAQAPTEVTGCKLVATPWFIRKSSCAVMDVNCYRRGIEGKEDQIDAILHLLDAKTLMRLTLLHCPRVQMTPTIHNFHQLATLELYNCSVDQWRQEASLHADPLESLLLLNFVLSNFSNPNGGLPEGLVRTSFPGQVLFSHTNLSSLPSNLYEFWTDYSCLVFDFCAFQAMPSTLFHMQTRQLYLAFTGDPFESIPSGEFAMDQVVGLSFSSTRLSQLPEQPFTKMHELGQLYLEHTRIHQIPAYIREWFTARVHAREFVAHSVFGSPYCTRDLDDPQELSYQSQVCAHDLQSSVGFYPMSIMEPQRQL